MLDRVFDTLSAWLLYPDQAFALAWDTAGQFDVAGRTTLVLTLMGIYLIWYVAVPMATLLSLHLAGKGLVGLVAPSRR